MTGTSSCNREEDGLLVDSELRRGTIGGGESGFKEACGSEFGLDSFERWDDKVLKRALLVPVYDAGLYTESADCCEVETGRVFTEMAGPDIKDQ
jgi:hypothetical protein